MDARLIEQRITCPFCNEPMVILIDLSVGGQSYVEDCQICCQPMQVSYAADENGIDYVRVDRAQ